MDLIQISYAQLIITFAGALLTGVLSGFGGAWVAIRVLGKEIEWINKTLDQHHKSIDRLHGRLSDHVAIFHTKNEKESG